MKTNKENLSKSILSFNNACEQSGQSGLISCGIAHTLRNNLNNSQLFWLTWDLINNIELSDMEDIKKLCNILAEKVNYKIDSISNAERDYKKASLLSRKCDHLKIFIQELNKLEIN